MRHLWLNQAGTTWPLPKPVRLATAAALADDPATWPTSFAADHATVARALGISGPEDLLLTPGGTSALSVAIADRPWQAGDRVLTSAMEHHAVLRPVRKLAARGVEHTPIGRTGSGPFDLATYARELTRGDVALVAVTAAANVTGELLPIADIVDLAQKHGITVLVDAAQTAGWLPVDCDGSGADLVVVTSHKGLHGPWGIGGLYRRPGTMFDTPAASCDPDDDACALGPGYCDVGSVNRAALAGLATATRWLASQTSMLDDARAAIAAFEASIADLPLSRVESTPIEERLPTLALRSERPVGELRAVLRARGIDVGAGAFCSPTTLTALDAEEGVLRISTGPMVPDDALNTLAEALRESV